MEAGELTFPFAGELQEQHTALRTAMRWFQAELDRREGQRVGCRRAAEFLRVFREQLVQHFRFEELSGFEGGAGSPDAEIQGLTLELMRQHRGLEARLRTLLERLDGEPADAELPAPLIAELGAFFGALRRHDAEESALILWISQGPTDFVRHPDLP